MTNAKQKVDIKVKKVELREAAKQAIAHHLYVDGWVLKQDLERYACLSYSPLTCCAYVAYDGKKPVALLLKQGCNLKAFVKETHRRRGIASKLIAKMTTEFPGISQSAWAEMGIQGSEHFWRRNNVRV